MLRWLTTRMGYITFKTYILTKKSYILQYDFARLCALTINLNFILKKMFTNSNNNNNIKFPFIKLYITEEKVLSRAFIYHSCKIFIPGKNLLHICLEFNI